MTFVYIVHKILYHDVVLVRNGCLFFFSSRRRHTRVDCDWSSDVCASDLVELPNAVPAIVAGVRLATVTTVALVTVGVVVGYGGLGQLMFRGFRNNKYHAEIMTATLLCLALALVLDLLLWLVGRAVTPWARRGREA